MNVLYKTVSHHLRTLCAWSKYKNLGMSFVHNKSSLTRQ